LFDGDFAILNPLFNCTVEERDFTAKLFAVEFQKREVELDELFFSDKHFFRKEEILFSN
jgi:hypothetical protein